MFGSNGPCSPADYMPHYTSILEPIYYPSTRDSSQQIQPLTFDSDPDCHSSAPPTPDIISGLISLTGGPSPSDLSSGSFGDLTSPEPDYHSASSPPSYSIDVSKVQATRRQLIKEGLKLTIQSRRMVQGLDNARPEYRMPPHEQLTPEDEDRRRRRRERNKVAATKCRNKKKRKNRQTSRGIRDARNQQQCLKIRNPLSGSRKERAHQPSTGSPASLFKELIKELLRSSELPRQLSCAVLVISFRLKML